MAISHSTQIVLLSMVEPFLLWLITYSSPRIKIFKSSLMGIIWGNNICIFTKWLLNAFLVLLLLNCLYVVPLSVQGSWVKCSAESWLSFSWGLGRKYIVMDKCWIVPLFDLLVITWTISTAVDYHSLTHKDKSNKFYLFDLSEIFL